MMGDRFISTVQDQREKVQRKLKIKFIETKQLQTTITTDTKTIKTSHSTTIPISKTTDTTTVPKHQTSNNTETTQTKNHVDIAIEQNTNQEVVQPVSTAEDWGNSLAGVERRDRIRTKIKIRTTIRIIRTSGFTTKTTTLTPLRDKRL